MKLSISLPETKTRAWRDVLGRLITLGVSDEQELQRVVGRLSFTQTCVYGEMGLAMPSPFYEKLKSRTYHPLLAERELNELRCWVVAMGALQPRTVRPYQKYPDLMVYTDAATSTQAICALVIGVGDFKSPRAVNECITMTTGHRWKTAFNKTDYSYGLEMLALLALVIDPKADIDGKAIIFYLDNDNAVKALVEKTGHPSDPGYDPPDLAHIIPQGVRAWFEWVGSDFNPEDLPTRNNASPLLTRKKYQFGNLNRARQLIQEGLTLAEAGHAVPTPRAIPGFSG